jgi:ADP-heptose:LPS heptosyltransferase
MKSKLHKNYPRWEDGMNAAHAWLVTQTDRYKILVEQNRNMGDTLHLTPIIRHYRNLHPDAAIAFIVGAPYANAHQYNPHVDKIFTLPNLEPTYRIQMRKKMLTFKDVDEMIAPSIFPYGSVWKNLNWSHANIADQYFSNAGIKDLKPIGGRKLVVEITEADKEWAADFIKRNGLNPKLTCGIEYNSYSARPKWNYPQFTSFAANLKRHHGINCVSIERDRALLC